LENIKSLITISTYIDNNLDLYLGGIDVVKGGVLKEPKKLGSNIVQVEGSNIGFLALDKDGNLYSFGKKGYSGSNNDEVYAELTKVDGIKDVVKIGSNGVSNDGYLALTKDGTVYAKRFDGPFTKLMENVKDIQGVYITDKDDVVYVWDEFTKDKVTKIAKSLQISWGGSSDSVWFIENNTIGNIADAMLVTKGTLSVNASRLIKKGYLTKYVDKEDRRVVRVEITDKARDILKIHDEFHENLIDRALEDLNLSDNEVLNKSFESILTYFKTEYRKMSQKIEEPKVKDTQIKKIKKLNMKRKLKYTV